MKLFVLICLPLIILTGCNLYDTFYITTFSSTQKNLTTVKLYSKTRKGWFGVSITNFKTSIYVVGFLNTTRGTVLELDPFNHGKEISQKTIQNDFIDTKSSLLVSNTLSFQFDVPTSLLEGNVNLTYAIYTGNTPKNLYEISKHTFTQTAPVNDLSDTSFGCFSSQIIQRIDTVIVPLYFSVQIFLILCIILWFYLYNKNMQPFKSRDISPLINLIVFSIGTFIIYLEEILDYRILDDQVKIGLFLRFITWTTTGFGMITASSIFSIVIIAYFIIVGAIFNFDCRNENLDRITLISTLILLLLPVLVLGLFELMDAIINFRKIIKCKLITFFFKRDPYFFRIEKLTLLPVAFILITLYFSLQRLDPIIIYILNSLIFHVILFYNFYLIALITIINEIISHFRGSKVEVKKGEIAETFQNETLLKKLIEFSTNEWSVENVLIKKDINRYNQAKTDSERRKIASNIISKYLSGSQSVMELNINSEPIRIVVEDFRRGNLDVRLFDQVEYAVDLNLKDIFFRFKFSTAYRDHIALEKTRRNLE